MAGSAEREQQGDGGGEAEREAGEQPLPDHRCSRGRPAAGDPRDVVDTGDVTADIRR
jgi:hypothetical protein